METCKIAEFILRLELRDNLKWVWREAAVSPNMSIKIPGKTDNGIQVLTY